MGEQVSQGVQLGKQTLALGCKQEIYRALTVFCSFDMALAWKFSKFFIALSWSPAPKLMALATTPAHCSVPEVATGRSTAACADTARTTRAARQRGLLQRITTLPFL